MPGLIQGTREGKQMRLGALAFAAALFGLGLPSARAEYIVNFSQVGNDVVASGSGTLNLSGLIPDGTNSVEIGIDPSRPRLSIGTEVLANRDIEEYVYFSIVNVSTFGTFGTGGYTEPTTTSGDYTEIITSDNPDNGEETAIVLVPHNYVSGGNLSGTDTFADSTFTSLGLTPGQYVYSWNVPDGSVIINIPGPTAVPEPASLALLGMGLAGIAAVRRRRAR